MNFRVSKISLVLIAGLVWVIAGANVLRIGIMELNGDDQSVWLVILESSTVFLLFFTLVFKKLYYKNMARIEQKKDKSCPFSFFDTKGWIMMTIMITAGIVVRYFHLIPRMYLSVFYIGLSLALIITGMLFVRYWFIRKVIRKDDSE